MKCKKCGREIDPLEVFPGGVCLGCHEERYNAEVLRSGGILPRPDFVGALNNRKRVLDGAARV